MHVHTFDWGRWVPTDDAVICFVRDNDHLLLIEKKRGLGGGKVNGPGGKLEGDETPLQAALRETEEEVGIVPVEPVRVAELSFVFNDGYSLRCDVFMTSRYAGTPVETPEARPFWAHVSEIPYERMWEDDVLWLPKVITGQKVAGRFIFDGDTMLSYTLRDGLDESYRTGLTRTG